MTDARELACFVLNRVERDNAYAAAVLSAESGALKDPRDAALAYEIVYGVLRNRPWLDHLLSTVSTRGIAKIPPPVLTTLRVAAYQIAFMEKIPASAAVFHAVDRTKKSRSSKLSGLVNALLRQLTRKPPESLRPEVDPRADDKTLARQFGLPKWLFTRFLSAFGKDHTLALGDAFNQPSKRTLRINVNSLSRDQALTKLGKDAQKGALSPWSVHVPTPKMAKSLVESGDAAYQDEAAQLAVLALDPNPGDRILDACAGRGGKTAAIAMAQKNGAQGSLFASDRSSSKLQRLAFELQKQSFHATTIEQDLVEQPLCAPLLQAAPFDKVLLDAPCSGTGTIGRRPEIRWRLEESHIPTLIAVQKRMLDQVKDLVRPGGLLVFVVCSILPEEGPKQAEQFLKRHKNFVMSEKLPSRWPSSVAYRNGCVILDPMRTVSDGYQIICFKKKQ